MDEMKEQAKTFADYTTCFSRVRLLPKEVVPIAICGVKNLHPFGCDVVGRKILRYPKLAPKRWFWQEWEKTRDNSYYEYWFKKEVLDPLDRAKTWEELKGLSHGAPFALVCFEPPGEFCHRHLVSAWLRDAGYEIGEF